MIEHYLYEKAYDMCEDMTLVIKVENPLFDPDNKREKPTTIIETQKTGLEGMTEVLILDNGKKRMYHRSQETMHSNHPYNWEEGPMKETAEQFCNEIACYLRLLKSMKMIDETLQKHPEWLKEVLK